FITAALFYGPTKLGESYNGYIQFFCQGLKATGDGGNFLLTRTKIPARSGHQLQVIYHDEANIMLALQAPAFGAQFHDAKTGRIVHKNISSKKASGRIDQSLKFVIIELTGSCRLCIDASFHC